MDFFHVDHPSSELSSPLTTRASDNSSKRSSPAGDILKGNFQDHIITPVDSEIVPVKKNVSWDPLVVEGSHRSPQKIATTVVPSETIKRASNAVIFLSQSIQKWATDLADQKTSELQDAEDALAYVKKNPTSLLPKIQQQLQEWHAVIHDQASQAKKYALWTTYRTELLKGNHNLQASLAQAGQSIDTRWTLKELREDWDFTKQEPWAEEDPQHHKIKEIIAPLVAQYHQAQREIQEAKTSHQKKSDNLQTAHNTNEYEPDNINVPGFGYLDRNKYDIGSVQDHGDGSYTVFDMTGRRYDYPNQTETFSNDSSCIVS